MKRVYSTKAVLAQCNPQHLALLQRMTGEKREEERAAFVGFSTRAAAAPKRGRSDR